VNKIDDQFDMIVQKDIKEKIALAFIDLTYKTRQMEPERQKKFIKEKANQLKEVVNRLADLLSE
jgi:hypothetical protein